MERLKKEIIQFFKSIKLEITIDTNLRHVDFLDVTFDLVEETFEPSTKSNSTTLFVNARSNHPPTVIKQLPKGIEKRLNTISCSKEKFEAAKQISEKALEESGYGKIKLEYAEKDIGEAAQEEIARQQAAKKKRKRKIIWFNPPFNKSLNMDLGAQFLKLIKVHFKKNHKLRKIFNRNTVKIGYSCTANMGAIIQSHNSKILNHREEEAVDKCNCTKRSCPLNGKCLSTKCVVYRAEVTVPDGSTKKYIGCTEGDFKTRAQGHVQSFTTASKKNATELAKFVWENNIQPEPAIKYDILKSTVPYKPGNRMCQLCNSEKLELSKVFNDSQYINKRDEIAQRCPHRKKHMLSAVT